MTVNPPARPWTPAQVRIVAACNLVAFLLVAIAATGADGQDSLQDQVSWLNLSVLGLLLAVVAHGALFLAARRAVGRRRLALVPDAIARVAKVAPPATDGRWWWVSGTGRAHNHSCQMISGKPAQEVAPEAIRANRLRRCELCG